MWNRWNFLPLILSFHLEYMLCFGHLPEVRSCLLFVSTMIVQYADLCLQRPDIWRKLKILLVQYLVLWLQAVVSMSDLVREIWKNINMFSVCFILCSSCIEGAYYIIPYYKAIGIITLQGFAYNHQDNSYMAKLEKVKFEQMLQIK